MNPESVMTLGRHAMEIADAVGDEQRVVVAVAQRRVQQIRISLAR